MNRWKVWLAARLRFWADRLDHAGAPKKTGLTFKFVDRVGIVVQQGGSGCPLWYCGDDDYSKAYDG